MLKVIGTNSNKPRYRKTPTVEILTVWCADNPVFCYSWLTFVVRAGVQRQRDQLCIIEWLEEELKPPQDDKGGKGFLRNASWCTLKGKETCGITNLLHTMQLMF